MASETLDEVPELVEAGSDEASQRAQLDDLIAQATSKYAVKDYNPAAELYSQATELQAELNGEMAIENADLLYSYGKCLYFVAVSKSDVLGTKAAGDKVGNFEEGRRSKPKSKTTSARPSGSDQEQKVAEEIVATIATEKEPGAKVDFTSSEKQDNKPFFQFTGDENWDDSDEEEETDPDAGDEEEEDDFSNAFEILDLARVLLEKKLHHLQETATATGDKGKCKADDTIDFPEVRQAKERLADTHDLQAEISLEGERFPNAVTDLRSALALKEELYPQESSQIAECHYKLSLALEFASVTQERDESGEAIEGKPAVVDEEMRKEAVIEMERAIESCELRIKKEQAEIDSRASGTSTSESRGKAVTQKDIDEVKELVTDMRQRLVDLKAPPVSINDPNSTGTLDGATPLSGILGQILGESPDEQKKRLEEASKNATDLSGLVKRKKPKQPSAEPAEKANGVAEAANGTNGKRKLDESETTDDLTNGKKSKVEDVPESS
ncbi:putative tetratricopeptide repeat domain protein [Phaeomoniella chlamydospora]|uniref:Putative tetratricopeptide repeat domain protein n=1 Tax=Phaeomoniella chlamydospora TaxID=158046 RepID=A0A0G2EKY9_PHACM|nr:putative tetratricopeptide repeat domain protein [Phaeomoniella chlamydospora]